MSEYITVVAYFPSQASAESAIDSLKAAGFEQSQIGVASASENADSAAYKAGHKAGGAWEKVKEFFSGDSAEPYAGEATGDALNDNVIAPEHVGSEDLHGSLTGMSVPEEHSRYFGHRLGTTSGGAMVTVNAIGREKEAQEILEENGGDVGKDAATFDYGTAAVNPTTAQKVQLYGDVLRVHKDRVSRGEVRIRKDVVTSTQAIEVPVTREELVLERVPVAGQQPATGAAFQGEEIRIPLTEERAAVSKEAVVREEVRVGKKEIADVETFHEQVRREELNVNRSSRDLTDKSA
jgi:uncharacterized protein (TIGR02271 family)